MPIIISSGGCMKNKTEKIGFNVIFGVLIICFSFGIWKAVRDYKTTQADKSQALLIQENFTNPLVQALMKKDFCLVDDSASFKSHHSSALVTVYLGKPVAFENPEYVLDNSKPQFVMECFGKPVIFTIPNNSNVNFDSEADELIKLVKSSVQRGYTKKEYKMRLMSNWKMGEKYLTQEQYNEVLEYSKPQLAETN